MGMSEQKNDRGKPASKNIFYFERIDLVPVVVIILIGSISLAYLIPNDFKDFSEIFRNLALVFGGFIGLAFAWQRLQKMDRQNEISAEEGERKDRAHISESLHRALEMLQEPTDSMKHLAIALLERLGNDYPNENLDHTIRSLCGQAREYDPITNEMELQLIKREAEDRCDRERSEEVAKLNQNINANTTQPVHPLEAFQARQDAIDNARKKIGELQKEESIQKEYKSALNGALLTERERRAREMIKTLVAAVNRLALKAGYTDIGTNERYEDEQIAIFDLRGVEVFSTTIHNITVNTLRFGGCIFDDVAFHNCTFTGTFEKSTKFLNCTFRDCKFGNSELSAVNFKGCDFSGSTLTNSTLRHVIWYDCSLCRVELARMKMSKKLNKMFASSDMTGVIFHITRLPPDVQIPDDLRSNYLATDFQANYVKKDGALPVGLDRNVPSLDAEPFQTSEDGKRQYFFVESDEESP